MSDLYKELRRWNRTFANLKADMQTLFDELEKLDRKHIYENLDRELGTALNIVHGTLDHVLADIDWQADDIKDLTEHAGVRGQLENIERALADVKKRIDTKDIE